MFGVSFYEVQERSFTATGCCLGGASFFLVAGLLHLILVVCIHRLKMVSRAVSLRVHLENSVRLHMHLKWSTASVPRSLNVSQDVFDQGHDQGVVRKTFPLFKADRQVAQYRWRP